MRLFLLIVVAFTGREAICGERSPGPEDPVPWRKALVGSSAELPVHTISAEAGVRVSDGLTYDVVTHYRGPQRVIFHRTYPDRVAASGIDGFYVWSFDGKAEAEGGDFLAQVSRGHQFHAMLLEGPEAVLLAKADGPGVEEKPGSEDVLLKSYSAPGGSTHTIELRGDSLLPVRMTTVLQDGTEIRFVYADWRETHGIRLPWRIDIDDGTRQFEYRFTDIRFDRDERDRLRAPISVLTDRQRLIRMHTLSMDAHLRSDASLLRDSWGEEVVFVSRGQVFAQSRAEVEAQMARSLGGRRHSVYEDLEAPRIAISEDGTLGTITVRIRAVGNRLQPSGDLGEAFEFVSAWTSVFRRRDGRWVMISNTSNFVP